MATPQSHLTSYLGTPRGCLAQPQWERMILHLHRLSGPG
ncbi:hypothetical protein T11_11831 [Trichinella zimbabwensis]|uniref:Uncharacterized protein n=1 Tax=Trichinella zimbabwensis TaxID=268475 RepID=A0A0V1EKM3_9BILA|nr:hypothetical protein T11_11831 [Trichinella zimbabwensis]